MAARLAYSEQGFERALMMARASVVAVVEGAFDVYFYEQLLGQYFRERACSGTYQVRTPKEVEGNADGKRALIQIFKRFRKRDRLRLSGGGGKDILFFTDKDYDDFSRRRLRNPNLIYTDGVTMENSAYAVGKLHQSLEALIGRRIETGALLATTDFNAWKLSCAQTWRDWLAFCLMCEISTVAPRKNRSGPSSIHTGDPPTLDRNAFDRAVAEVADLLGDAEAAEAYLRRSQRIVDQALRRKSVDKVFCGKWFAYFLKTDIRKLGGVYLAHAGRIRPADLLSHLLQGVEFTSEVRDYYFQSIDAVLAA